MGSWYPISTPKQTTTAAWGLVGRWRKTSVIDHTELGPGPRVRNLHQGVRGGTKEAQGRGGGRTDVRHWYFSFNIFSIPSLAKRDDSTSNCGPTSPPPLRSADGLAGRCFPWASIGVTTISQLTERLSWGGRIMQPPRGRRE